MQQTAGAPWDDRRAADARVEDLREARVREYLRDVQSGLLDEPAARDAYLHMRITAPANNHEVPRNAELLFFQRARTVVSGCSDRICAIRCGSSRDVQEERVFGGALVDQIRGCLNHLENLSASHLQK